MVLVDRADKIEGGLKRAEDAQRQAQLALEQYSAQLADARTEASSIRTAAAEERKAIVEEARSEALAAAAPSRDEIFDQQLADEAVARLKENRAANE